MKVTKNVIEDLIPMYLADEVSKDTRLLVKEYLTTDPELAERIKKLSDDFNKKIDIPLNRDDQLEALIKTKKLQTIRTIVLAVIFSGVFLAILAAVMMFTKR